MTDAFSASSPRRRPRRGPPQCRRHQPACAPVGRERRRIRHRRRGRTRRHFPLVRQRPDVARRCVVGYRDTHGCCVLERWHSRLGRRPRCPHFDHERCRPDVAAAMAGRKPRRLFPRYPRSRRATRHRGRCLRSERYHQRRRQNLDAPENQRRRLSFQPPQSWPHRHALPRRRTRHVAALRRRRCDLAKHPCRLRGLVLRHSAPR